jgi:hypothetical protein
LEPIQARKLIVINSEVSKDPDSRGPELDSAGAQRLAAAGAAVLSARDLYAAYANPNQTLASSGVWSLLVRSSAGIDVGKREVSA